MIENLERLIADHPFFAEMPEKYIALLAGCASNVRLPADELIFEGGQKADVFYLIREGRVGLQLPVPDEGHVTIQTVEAGDVVGWSWLFPPYETYFDVRTFTPFRAVRFDGACLRGKCAQDSLLAHELVKRFARVMRSRLQVALVRLLDFYKVPQV